jgi:hypothetical protein
LTPNADTHRLKADSTEVRLKPDATKSPTDTNDVRPMPDITDTGNVRL